MRPARKILVYSTNDDECGIVCFTLRQRTGYSVGKCISKKAIYVGLTGFHPGYADGIRLLVLIHEGRSSDAASKTLSLLKEVNSRYPELRILLVDAPGVLSDGTPATLRVIGIPTTANLVEAVKVLSSRKRGPKPVDEICQSSAA